MANDGFNVCKMNVQRMAWGVIAFAVLGECTTKNGGGGGIIVLSPIASPYTGAWCW
jgi:hypothetical protein